MFPNDDGRGGVVPRPPLSLDGLLAHWKVVIACHEFVWGPANAVEEYLAPRVRELLVVRLPFHYAPDTRPLVRLYRRGRLVQAHRYKMPLMHEPAIFARDALFLAWAFLRWGWGCDLFVGTDCFVAAGGVAFRMFHMAKRRVIFYPIDFSPRRFDNNLMNHLYHAVEEFCSRYADFVWNASPLMHQERVKRSGNTNRAPHIYMPIGVIGVAPAPQNTPTPRLVFLGNLLEKQGLQHAIGALPTIARSVPNIELIVIGTGEYEETLHKLADASGCGHRIRFLGYIEDHREVDALLGKGGVGLATYDTPPDSYTRFADPGKVKNYLAAALPVMITQDPPVARELAARGCAFLVEPSPDSIAKTVIALLSNADRFRRASQMALLTAQPFVWTHILEDGLKAALSEMSRTGRTPWREQGDRNGSF